MHVGWISRLGELQDGAAFDAELLRERVAGRLHFAPRFRQRVVSTPLGEPVWADDPSFRIERHLRVVDDDPLTEAELQRLSDDFISAPLDRRRPLWEIVVVPRLAGRGAALLGKVHHAMVDGIAAVELGMLLFDIAPDAAQPEPVDWVPEHLASPIKLAATSVGDAALDQFRSAGRLAAMGMRPRQTLRVAESMRRAAISLADDALNPAPGSYLNAEIDERRTLVTGSVSFERLRRLKDHADAKLNDIVLAISSGALRRLAGICEEPPGPLRAMVPVSVRGDGDNGAEGNRITFAFLDLPVAEPDPARRLALVCESTAELKLSGRTAGSDVILRSVVGQLPAPLKERIARFAASPRLYNLTISNVPGPQRALYAAGARVESIHPVIPLSDSHALALGVLSYGDRLTIAAHANPGALPEAAELPWLFEQATQELEHAVGLHSRRSDGGDDFERRRPQGRERRPGPGDGRRSKLRLG